MVDEDSTEDSDLVSTAMLDRELVRELRRVWEFLLRTEGGSTSTGFSSLFT